MPIRVTIRTITRVPPESIAEGILDSAQWASFKGWGPMPGIRSAAFTDRPDGVVGSRIAVTNTDGSTHTETITGWDPPRSLSLRLDGFSRPLDRLATHFTEAWAFEPDPDPDGPRWTITRRFELHPAGVLGAVALRLVAPMLAAAVRRHMRVIEREQAESMQTR